jgi:hypothetical protein
MPAIDSKLSSDVLGHCYLFVFVSALVRRIAKVRTSLWRSDGRLPYFTRYPFRGRVYGLRALIIEIYLRIMVGGPEMGLHS